MSPRARRAILISGAELESSDSASRRLLDACDAWQRCRTRGRAEVAVEATSSSVESVDHRVAVAICHAPTGALLVAGSTVSVGVSSRPGIARAGHRARS